MFNYIGCHISQLNGIWVGNLGWCDIGAPKGVKFITTFDYINDEKLLD